MNREEAMSTFQENVVNPTWNQVLFHLDERFRQNALVWGQDFFVHLVKAFEKICELQNQEKLGEINYIFITFLRTNLLEKRMELSIYAADKNWWFDEKIQQVGVFPCSYIFQPYYDCFLSFNQLRKKYVGKIIEEDIWHMQQEEGKNLLCYIERVSKLQRGKIQENNSFKKIKKGSEIKIYVGEHMDLGYLVYFERLEKRTVEEEEELQKNILEKKEEILCLEDLRRLQIKSLDLKGSDFRLSNLSDSELNQVDLSYSLLIGTIFSHCQLNRSNFRHSILNEADFSHCNLIGACFARIEANEGLINQKIWEYPSYFPIRFQYADLKNADFTRSKLNGADFSYANLENADFSGCSLENANFNEAILKNTKFFPAQLKSLKLTKKQFEQVQVVNPYGLFLAEDK